LRRSLLRCCRLCPSFRVFVRALFCLCRRNM
jgi:hypothetical protein